MNQDKQGCYRVGDLKFYSKIEAIEAMQKTGIHLHWDFNEAVFSSYDWKKEPTESLQELYKRRASQLREKYDYLILMYSGGADSQNVLDTFLDNNIYLDEVCTFLHYEGNNQTDDYCNGEQFNVVIPMMKKYKEKHPWLKHRIVDFTQPVLDFFCDKKNRYDWFYDFNLIYTPTTVVRNTWVSYVEEYIKLIDSGKRICFIWAVEKPRIFQVDGKFVFRFMDVFWGSVRSLAGLQPYTDEFFYWSPDLPKLLIKQAHVIKNYISLPDFPNIRFVSREKSDLAYREINGQKWWLSNHGMHTLLYPTWDITTYTVGKPSSVIISPRDIWFFAMEDTNPIKLNWQIGFKKFEHLLPAYWWNDPNDISKGVKSCLNDYYLE